MDRIQLRRDSSARWTEINPILLEGEVGYEIDTKLRKIGDGVTRWNDLEYLRAEGISQETGNSQNITMSQDAITRELSELGSEVDEINILASSTKQDVYNLDAVDNCVIIDGAFMSLVNNDVRTASTTEYGLKYFKVFKGNTYKIIAYTLRHQQYAQVGFFKDIPQIGSTIGKVIKSLETTLDITPKIDFSYTATEDGYIAFANQTPNGVDSSKVYVVNNTTKLEDAKKELDKKINDLDSKVYLDNIHVEGYNLYQSQKYGVDSVLEPIYEISKISGGFISVSSKAIVVTESAEYNLKYIKVVKGRTYFANCRYTGGHSVYASIAFSRNEPSVGNLVDYIISTCNDEPGDYPPIKEFFTASEDGYLIVWDWYDRDDAEFYLCVNQSLFVKANNRISTNNHLLFGNPIKECFISAKSAEGLDYALFGIHNDEDSVTIQITTTENGSSYVFNETYNGHPSVISGIFRDNSTEIHLVIDWAKVKKGKNNLGYESTVFTENCYDINYSPTIKDVVEQEPKLKDHESRLTAIESNFSKGFVLIGNGISDNVQIIENTFAYTSGKIVNYEGPVGFYAIEVKAGNKYKVSVKDQFLFTVYASIAFATKTTFEDGDYIDVLYITDNESATYDYEYRADKDGYLMQAYRGDTSNANNVKFYIEQLQPINKPTEKIELIPTQKKNIVCSGSSITWGAGALDDSMVKYVDKYLKDNMATSLMASELDYSIAPTTITNSLLYNKKGMMIEGVGASVEFDLFGDEVSICQMKRRSTDYGLLNVYADDVQIGCFDNKNDIRFNSEEFSGTSIKDVRLAHPCTFNHKIYINGSSTALTSVVFSSKYGDTIPSNCEAFVYRASKGDGSETCHGIQFADSLGVITSVRVEYNYGRIIAHERSTVGQTSNEYTNENYYGKGSVSYDPANPKGGIESGMEFRAIDERAFFTHKFSEAKKRHFKIEIIGGVNPYFIVNFVTNRYHNLMNAGIGGWQLSDLLYLSNKLNHYTQFFKYWKPDILFEEAMTNDDWVFKTRRIKRNIGEISLSELKELNQLEVHTITYNNSTDKYKVEMCTGIIESITSTSLVSSDIIGTETKVGDIVRIGNYYGDMKSITCRTITSVDLDKGEIQWLEPIVADSLLNVESLSDLIGAEINIRNLDEYEEQYNDLIDKVHEISPNTKIVVVHNGLPNLFIRQLWGYDIIHAKVSKKANVEFINVQEHIYNAMFNTISGNKKETVVSTGASLYELTFAGGSYKGWQGFKVLVNGIDVYGKDAYIEMVNQSYKIKDGLSGSTLNKTNAYDRSNCDWYRSGTSFILHFKKNVPSVDDTIEVQYADNTWSNDFCHPTDLGAKLYAEIYNDYLRKE